MIGFRNYLTNQNNFVILYDMKTPNKKLMNEYLEFIKTHSLSGHIDGYYEKHHIYPRVMFPELKNDKTNIVKLRAIDHLRAHIYLYRLYQNKEMTFALNMMMNRGHHSKEFSLDDMEKNFEKCGIDYEKFRIETSKCISEANKGTKRTEKQKENLSKIISGKVVVKDKTGNVFQVKKNDYRYINGELVFYRKGLKHSSETKQKMSENGIKGLKGFYNDDGKRLYSDICPNGFCHGLPNKIKDKIKATISNLIYLYNPSSNKSIRINKNNSIPTGFIHKRNKCGKFVGFDKINESINSFNIRTKEYHRINKNNINWNEEIVSISASDRKDIRNNYLFLVDNVIYTVAKDLHEYMNNKFNVILPKRVMDSNKLFGQYIQSEIDIDEIKKMRYTKQGKNKIILDNRDVRLSDLLNIKVVRLGDLEYSSEYTIFNTDRKKRKYDQRL